MVRELLGRVKATVMGAVANADVPLEEAAEAAGLPPTAPLDAVHCVVHDEGFFRVEMEAEGLEARPPPHPPPTKNKSGVQPLILDSRQAHDHLPHVMTRSWPPAVSCAA